MQVAVGLRHWDPGYDQSGFWIRVMFYNYNTTFFPGAARLPLPWNERMSPQIARLLKEVLSERKPSHAVVWGVVNWSAVRVDGVELKENGADFRGRK